MADTKAKLVESLMGFVTCDLQRIMCLLMVLHSIFSLIVKKVPFVG
jgi:hypothetical protein